MKIRRIPQGQYLAGVGVLRKMDPIGGVKIRFFLRNKERGHWSIISFSESTKILIQNKSLNIKLNFEQSIFVISDVRTRLTLVIQ